MGKKKDYESPFIKRTQVETESGFCAASVINEKKTQVVSAGQEEGSVLDTNNNDENGWNSPWE